MAYVLDHDPRLTRLHRQALALLRGAPDGDTGGVVEIRRFQDDYGSVSYAVWQRSNSGGWSSPSTPSLAAADLAATALAIQIGAVLLECKECDADTEGNA